MAKDGYLAIAAEILANAGRSNSANTLRAMIPKTALAASARPAAVAANAPNPVVCAPIDPERAQRNMATVALIADEFTFNSFANEFNAVAITPDNWQAKFEECKPDVLFCESAWSGPDPEEPAWRGRIYASDKFPYENRKVLLDIVAHCRKAGIPTVFWNKEDPTHFADKSHNFVKTACEFDFVFTSAEECVDRYRTEHGVKNVDVLPFATNPLLFNPIRASARSANVIFAGSWYGNHPDRCEVTSLMLDKLLSLGFGLELYDRYYGSTDGIRVWPDRFKRFVKPNVPHSQIAAVYKRSHFGLNINTVTSSPTMFARRVFELASSNTLVLSNYSTGMDRIFSDSVVFVDRDPGVLRDMDYADLLARKEKALQITLSDHTYRARWQKVMAALGMAGDSSDRMTFTFKVSSLEEAEEATNIYNRLYRSRANSELLLVAPHDMGHMDVAKLYRGSNRFGAMVVSAREVLEGRTGPAENIAIGSNYTIVDQSDPASPDWIEKALPHLQYAPAIGMAESDETKYEYGRPRNGNAIGRAATIDQQMLTNSHLGEMYRI